MSEKYETGCEFVGCGYFKEGNCPDWNGYVTKSGEAVCGCRNDTIPVKSQDCVWKWDDIDEKWDTECGEAWCFMDGGPKENRMKFCGYCGKPIQEEKPTEETDCWEGEK